MKDRTDDKFKLNTQEKDKNNKKKIWLVACILGVIILLFGITFAIFRYSKTSNNSSLVLGDIYMSSKGDNIVLNKLEPMNPNEGIDKGSKYSFSVEGYNTSNKDIYYGVYLNYGSEETGKTRFKDTDLMMYLTETKNGETRAVYGPGSVKDFNDKMIYANTINAATKKEEKVEINYELTVWLSDNIVITDTEESYEGKNVYTTDEYANSYASIDVKVYGDFEEKNIKKANENITGTIVSTNENYEIKDDIKDAVKTDKDVKIVITTDKEAKLYITNLDTGVKKEETLTLKNNLYTFERVETEKSRYSYYFEYLDSTISQIYYYNINILKVELISKPTNVLCSNKVYNGSEQLITTIENNDSYSISNNRQINAGEYQVVVKLKNGFMWDDQTSDDVTFTCKIDKASTSITLSKNQATINYTDEITFTVKTSQAGSLSIQNGNDSVVTVDPTRIDVAEANVEQVIKLTGKEKGTSVITIAFTPISSNYSSSSVTYDLNVVKKYCAYFNKNGAESLNGATDEELDMCCTVENGSSCDVVSPTIVPIDNYEVLGWATTETATSATYNNGATITLTTDDNDFFAITRSLDSTRQTKTINFNINGADSFTYSGTTYTTDKAITCKTDYGYNGEALPDSCTIKLPTITRSGGTVYGWNEDNEARTATHEVSSTYEVYDNTTLNAITSKPIKLSFNANSGSTTLTTMVGQAYNYDKGADFVIPSYDNSNMCRSATNFTNFSKGSFAANGYLLGYKYIGLTDVAGSSEVKYCQGNYIYIEKDTTLHAIWNEDYATTLVTSGDNLNLRTGCGTGYGTTGSSMSGSTTIYVNQEGSKYSSGYMGYWVKYGSRTGCASCKYLRSFLYYPANNSCTRTDYVCNGGSAADITMSPSNAVLNLKKSDMLSTTLSVDSRCGTWTVSNSNSSIVTATKVSSGVQLTAVSGSVAENSSKTATITVTGQWGCTATATITVKNTNATKPTVTISIDGDSSTCSDSYIKGATATITCSSPLIPITGFSGGIITSDGTNTKTATVSLSSTGSKTVTASCSNEEGTTNVSKAVTIKVKSASSACGCNAYKYNCSCTCGKRYNGSCTSVKSTTTATSSSGCASACKSRCTSLYGSTNISYCGSTGSYTGKTCKSHKTCCHT